MNKIEMARVVVQALRNLPDLPHEDTAPEAVARDIKREARPKQVHVEDRYELALKVLDQRKPAELPAVEIETSPNYHKNYGGICGDGEPCAICGKEVKPSSKTAHYIRMGRGGGHAVTNEEADADPGGDLGCQPIGPDCWKKHPELHVLENGKYTG